MAPRNGISPLAEAKELVEFNRKVFDRYYRRVLRLPWKEATRERETGHHTLFRTLVHILNVQELWLVYVVRGRHRELPALWKDERRQPTTRAGLIAYSARVWKGVDETLRLLRDEDFGRRVHVPWFSQVYSVRDGFYQATFEEAHHIGEMIGAFWQDDVDPPLMMWIPLLRSRPKKRAARRR